MRAVVINEFGATPELTDMPVPEPGARAVRVQLEAAGVNPFDRKIAEGILDGKLPQDFPLILGVDGAGTVVETGAEVTRFAVGDRVVGKFLADRAGHGSFAEYSVLSEDATLVRIPDGIATMAAAAIPTAGVTAQDLVDAAKIEPDETVLIVGATGGVGVFLVQLSNLAGAQVIATARGAAADQMNRLGAAETIDYTEGSVAEQMTERYPDGIDVLFDLVSPPGELAELTALVRDGGTVFSTIGAADQPALLDRGIKGGNFESNGAAPELARLLRRVSDGDVVIPIESTAPLAQAATVIAKPGARGKTVLSI
ncbi:NADP-dependent oxidoreductase [Nocardia sp. XZ_19_385]|uniref:NADP-dependent oxidoreductase n=1 Tax=Nocardia sp. XZ_19_385 TaxID=2769488 RepID=UPI00188F8042|nr:NADP-dependent oxidoreductase [Nocardia sp. XZ_19_385]